MLPASADDRGSPPIHENRALVARPLLAVAAVTTMLVVPGLPDPINLPKLVALVTGIGIAAASTLGRPKVVRRDPKARLVSVVFLVGLSVAALSSAQFAYRTLYGVWGRNDGFLAYAAMAALFLLLVRVLDTGSVAAVPLALAVVGGVQTLFAVVQWIAGWPLYAAPAYAPIMGSFGNPDFAAAFLGLAAAALGYLALRRSHPLRWQVTSGVLGLGALAAARASQSLQGPLAFVVAVSVGLAAYLYANPRSRAARLRHVYVGACLALALLAIAGMNGLGPLHGVMASGDLGTRFYEWRTALTMWRAHPALGVGLDAFGDWYGVSRGPELLAGGLATPSNAAHSVPLQLLATGGVVLFLPYVVLVGFIAVRGVRAIRRGHDPLLTATLVGLWVAWQAQSLFSIDELGIAVWGWVLGAAVVVQGAPEGLATAVQAPVTAARSRSWVPRILPAIAVLAVLWPVATTVRITAVLVSAEAPRDAVDVFRSLQLLPDPTMVTVAMHRLEDLGAPHLAARLGERAVERFPRSTGVWMELRDAYLHAGATADVARADEHLAQLEPLNPEFRRA